MGDATENNKNTPSSKDTGQQSLQEEVNHLKGQYHELLKEVKAIDKNEEKISHLSDSIEAMYKEFEEMNKTMHEITQMSKSIQEITEKLDRISEGQPMKNRNMRMFGNMFRRAAVRTTSSVLAVVDTTVEKTSLLKEGIEDIVAEAQYENKRRRMNMTQGQH